jgi:transglutaminase-like putative cysteine protease
MLRAQWGFDDGRAVTRPAKRSLDARSSGRFRPAGTDGIVKLTADRITAESVSDLDAARRIYGWVVATTYWDPNTLGCGVGEIKATLDTGNLGGKSADINALSVALARASGIPARDL